MASAKELQEKGVKLFQQKDYEEAVATFHEAAEAYATEGQNDMVAEMKSNIGLVHRALGENQKALDVMQEALEVFVELDDARRTAMALGNLGGVYVAMGDKEQAYQSYRQAADLFQEIGERKLHGETLIAMADLQVRDGKLGAGAATYEVGLSELDKLTASQKVLKGLIGIRNKVIGGGQQSES